MKAPGADAGAELSFLAAPGDVCDWRFVLVFAAADEAGVLAALPGAPEELAARLSLEARAVRVLLDELAVFEVVRCDEAGWYNAGPLWPGPDAAATLHHHARALRSWSAAIDDRLQGFGPPTERRSPPRLERWLDALAVNARRVAPESVDACLVRMPGARRALDLGGGHGEYAFELARRGLHVVLQDRPEVIDIARGKEELAKAGVELFAGDFFETLPEGRFDLVFCAGVTHTYGPGRVAELCGRLAGAVASGGGLAVQTFLRGRSAIGALFAVQMLVGANGVDTHDKRQYRQWLSEAGFGRVEVIDSGPQGQSIVVARR